VFTVSVTGLLVTLPRALLTWTLICAPVSCAVAEAITYVLALVPASAPLLNH
jgi:hypothetical protein